MPEDDQVNEQMAELSEKFRDLCAQAETLCEQHGFHPVGVRIVASVDVLNSHKQSARVTNGTGNLHAQMQATREWLRFLQVYDDEDTRRKAQIDMEDEDDDRGF